MPVYQYRKSVVSPAGGVDYSKKPHLLDLTQWYTLNQMRCRLGAMSDFPGWATMMASGDIGTMVSMIKEFRRKSGTIELVLGGNDKIYQYVAATRTLTDITGAASIAPTRARPWHSTVWNDVLYFTQKINGLYKWTGSGNIAAVAGAPKLWTVRVLKNHIAGFGVDTNPFTFQWAAEATETFTASSTNDAGSFDVVESSGEAVGLEHLGESLIGYKQKDINMFTYVGGKEVVGRRQMVPDVGLIGPHAIVVFQDRHFFMGNPYGFYEYTGSNYADDSFGDSIREKVFGDINKNLISLSRAIYWPDTFESLWAYPSSTATLNPNKCVIHNHKDKVWYGPFSIDCDMFGSAEIATVSVIDSDTRIIDSVSDIIDMSGVGANSIFVILGKSEGSIQQIGAANTDNGTAITRSAETGDIFIGRDAEDQYGTVVSFPLSSIFQVNQVNLELDNIADANINFYIGSRMDLNDPISWSDAYAIKAYSSMNIEVPVRKTGRWFRLKFEIPSSRAFSLFGYQFLFSYAGVR